MLDCFYSLISLFSVLFLASFMLFLFFFNKKNNNKKEIMPIKTLSHCIKQSHAAL